VVVSAGEPSAELMITADVRVVEEALFGRGVDREVARVLIVFGHQPAYPRPPRLSHHTPAFKYAAKLTHSR
jgi:hypothetical protein